MSSFFSRPTMSLKVSVRLTLLPSKRFVDMMGQRCAYLLRFAEGGVASAMFLLSVDGRKGVEDVENWCREGRLEA